jgi:hypothetical protein
MSEATLLPQRIRHFHEDYGSSLLTGSSGPPVGHRSRRLSSIMNNHEQGVAFRRTDNVQLQRGLRRGEHPFSGSRTHRPVRRLEALLSRLSTLVFSERSMKRESVSA